MGKIKILDAAKQNTMAAEMPRKKIERGVEK